MHISAYKSAYIFIFMSLLPLPAMSSVWLFNKQKKIEEQEKYPRMEAKRDSGSHIRALRTHGRERVAICAVSSLAMSEIMKLNSRALGSRHSNDISEAHPKSSAMSELITRKLSSAAIGNCRLLVSRPPVMLVQALRTERI